VNEIDFHPNGRYLLSSSNDSTLKIWDLRQGHILYTLYGHEGASTSAAFSPCGDYFTTGGADSVVMVWKSNLDENEQEFIEDFGAKSADDGKQVGGVPPAAPRRPPTSTKKAVRTSAVKSKAGSPERSVAGGAAKIGGAVSEMGQEPQPVLDADDGGVAGTGEELAQTLEKVVSQLDIISRTLNVLEQRVSANEESVGNVMAYFHELRAQKEAHAPQQPSIRQTNLGYSQS
jgi:centriolar protein POC1